MMRQSEVLKLTEHEIQSTILDWLDRKHIFHWRNNTGAMAGSHKGKRWFVRFGPKGAPDIFAVINGHIIGIEVKGPNGKLSVDQEKFRMGMRIAGGGYIVAYQLEDVTAVLG